jgi:hypothetical protein
MRLPARAGVRFAGGEGRAARTTVRRPCGRLVRVRCGTDRPRTLGARAACRRGSHRAFETDGTNGAQEVFKATRGSLVGPWRFSWASRWPAARGRATARASLRGARLTEVREGGDAVARAVPGRELSEAAALRGDHGEPRATGAMGHMGAPARYPSRQDPVSILRDRGVGRCATGKVRRWSTPSVSRSSSHHPGSSRPSGPGPERRASMVCRRRWPIAHAIVSGPRLEPRGASLSRESH